MKPSPEKAAAKAAGERFYFTGKPCSKGHLSKRSIRTSVCAQCAVEASMRSMAKRPWHPARLAAKGRDELHYSTGKPCPHGHDKRWVRSGSCMPCDVIATKKWNKKNPGNMAAGARRRRAKDPTGHRAEVKRWRDKNREKAYEALKKWKVANIEHVRAMGRASVNRRRTRKAANGGTFTVADIEALHVKQNGCCAVCPTSDGLEIDHVLPIVLGGSSDPSNLQLLCLPCNRSKGAKHPDQWRAGLK